jgi:hypothetical protein
MTTASVERRQLHFDSIEDLESEIARIERAFRSGQLVAIGNWSAGQILSHLGAWIEFGYEGYPPELRPIALPLRLLLKLVKRRVFANPMSPGVRLPGTTEGTLATEPASFDQGMARLRRNLQRLRHGESPRHASPYFGRLSRRDAVLMALRHAELHLSYLRY